MKKLITFVALVMLVACAGPSEVEKDTPDHVTGVITEIESPTFGEVEYFMLREGGETYQIYIADDVEYGFPLSHLHEHLGTDPVACELEERDGKFYALSIEDV